MELPSAVGAYTAEGPMLLCEDPSGSFLNRRFYIHVVSFSSFFLIIYTLELIRKLGLVGAIDSRGPRSREGAAACSSITIKSAQQLDVSRK